MLRATNSLPRIPVPRVDGCHKADRVAIILPVYSQVELAFSLGWSFAFCEVFLASFFVAIRQLIAYFMADFFSLVS